MPVSLHNIDSLKAVPFIRKISCYVGRKEMKTVLIVVGLETVTN